jgi:hypothetical protein
MPCKMLVLFACLVCSHVAFSQTPFTRTYNLGGGIKIACCADGQFYGFTPLIQDTSLSGTVKIVSVSVSDNAKILIANNGNCCAGTTWEIFVGSASCGFPVGQEQGGISLGTYSCSADNAETQLIFNTNGVFSAPTTGKFAGEYDFNTGKFIANDIGAFISGTTSPSDLTEGLFAQILLWSGDQDIELGLRNISITITGVVE